MPTAELKQPNNKYNLPFGQGNLGQDHELDSYELGRNVESYLIPTSQINTAYCGDGRSYLRVGGIDDQDSLDKLVVPTLFGGLGLALTRGLIAADTDYAKKSKDVVDLYFKVLNFLDIHGYSDAGHRGCAASANLENLFVNSLHPDELLTILNKITLLTNKSNLALQKNYDTKRLRVEAGYLSNWNSKLHEEVLASRYPDNFSELKTEESPCAGHYEEAIVFINLPDVGLSKNKFNRNTNSMVFTQSIDFAKVLSLNMATKLGLTNEQAQRLQIELVSDGLQVMNLLCKKNLSAYVF